MSLIRSRLSLCAVALSALAVLVFGGSLAFGKTDPRTKAAITQLSLPAGSQPSSIVTGPEGDLWFTEPALTEIGRSTAGGKGVVFKDPGITGLGVGGPSHIARGADGNLWFTTRSPDYIGKITPAGLITNYPISGTTVITSNLKGIVAGPKGEMWFASPTAIYAITTTGTITQYPVPDQLTPQALTAGSNGDIWFAATKAGVKRNGYIVRLTATGTFVLHQIPLAGASPGSLTLGPDHAFWFTETGRIGRITTAGKITQFRLPNNPTGSAATFGQIISTGGDLWFASPNTDQIVRLTTKGTFYRFGIPTPSTGPTALATGPGTNNIWFTEPGSDRIGRLAFTR